MHPEMGAWSRQCEAMRARGTFRGATVQPEASTLRLCLAQVWNSRLALYVMPCDRARLRIWTDEAESSPERRSVGASSRLPNPGHGGARARVRACAARPASARASVRACVCVRVCVRACAARPAPTDSHSCVRMHTSIRPVHCSGVSADGFVRPNSARDGRGDSARVGARMPSRRVRPGAPSTHCRTHSRTQSPLLQRLSPHPCLAFSASVIESGFTIATT